MSKDKLIPELRFPEFINEGEWEDKVLSDVADRITVKVGEQKLTTVSISAGIGFVSQKEKFSRDISGNQYKNYIFLRQGEFAFNKGNSKKFPQGCIYQLNEFKEAAAPNAFLCFRFKSIFLPDFYKGYFDNNYHGRQLQKFITSGARMDGLLNISPNNFFNIHLPTPTNRREQQKIASCLSSLDELISAHSDKLEALKDQKKGLMQNLFPQEGETVPKLRFPEFEGDGEWIDDTLGERGDFYGGGTPRKSNPEFWKGDFPWVSSSDIDEESINNIQITRFITEDAIKESATKIVPSNSLLIVSRVGVGKVALTQKEICTSQDFSNFTPHKDEPIFLGYYLKSLKNTLLSFSQGMAIKGFTKDDISGLSLCFPSKKEQQIIGSCLSALDELIMAQSKKIEELEKHKRGLMQGLYPSVQR
ncbi:MAG: restriction endonuclease subunit S [Cytophagales bacterium]|nr:restriction endonuclease subunit S [Cytophagales bacterium]